MFAQKQTGPRAHLSASTGTGTVTHACARGCLIYKLSPLHMSCAPLSPLPPSSLLLLRRPSARLQHVPLDQRTPRHRRRLVTSSYFWSLLLPPPSPLPLFSLNQSHTHTHTHQQTHARTKGCSSRHTFLVLRLRVVFSCHFSFLTRKTRRCARARVRVRVCASLSLPVCKGELGLLLVHTRTHARPVTLHSMPTLSSCSPLLVCVFPQRWRRVSHFHGTDAVLYNLPSWTADGGSCKDKHTHTHTQHAGGRNTREYWIGGRGCCCHTHPRTHARSCPVAKKRKEAKDGRQGR